MLRTSCSGSPACAVQVLIFSDAGTEASETSTVTSHVIVETVANVLSSVAATIRAGADDGCSIDAISNAQVC